MHIGTRALLAVATAVAVATLAGCGGDIGGDSMQQPSPGQVAPGTGTFKDIDTAARELVTRQAYWQAPAVLDVERTQRIGLAVGEGEKLTQKINAMLAGTKPTALGRLEVGPTVKATLRGNTEDVEITPSESVNATTGSDVQMLWTWLVHPKHPTDDLLLTAYLEVPLSNGHVITHEVALSVQVRRTMAYTVWQVITHWGTWSAVVTSIIGVVSWLLRRRRKKKGAAQQEEAPEPSVANVAV
ncbi:hypothetical protein [Catellatospora citrea]|uniref:LPXTG-motif cell wall-anchored protein n=1 Tax=Catellatospora citrea TaxID=53366 RepID=A0A8J3KAB7_9ACTN|nr:hypothetical protein [Catellatospora citrea]RKE07283.1 hypothetical protein C8E86_2108 [Catellatospora citrea]GIF95438.1 hypothetical protein Cci01nite_05320 [Catellatospora citrea]